MFIVKLMINLEKPGLEPALIGTLETNQKGEPVFKKI